MASVSVLACNALWARLIFAESNWKCLWLRLVAMAIGSLPPRQYTTDVHVAGFHVHRLGPLAEARPAPDDTVYVTLSRVCTRRCLPSARNTSASWTQSPWAWFRGVPKTSPAREP